jgi:uncharacterized protein (DUF1697 family)
MPRYAAFLRAINVGKRRVKMEQLVSIFTNARFRNVSTLIASGNVWFDSNAKSIPKLRTHVEAILLDGLGYEVDTFLRTEQELVSVFESNPFQRDQVANPSVNVHVFFFHEPLDEDAIEVLVRNKTQTDTIEVLGLEAFWRCEGKMTDSVFWEQPDVKKLILPVNTSRNIDTIERMIGTL